MEPRRRAGAYAAAWKYLLYVLVMRAAGGGALPGPDDEAFIGARQVQYLNLAAVRRFSVHPMFRAHLGIQDDLRSSVS